MRTNLILLGLETTFICLRVRRGLCASIFIPFCGGLRKSNAIYIYE